MGWLVSLKPFQLATLHAGPRILIVSRKGDQLQAAIGGEKLDIFPESATDFFFKATDAEIRFVPDESGNVSQLYLRAQGQSITGRRLAESQQSAAEKAGSK